MSENDRYLFKAKSENTDGTFSWHKGYLSKCEGEYIICDDDGTGVFIDENTICQCTGLRDKNGNLIWENDIVTYTDELVNKVKIDKIGWNETHAAFTRLHKSQMGLQYLYINEGIAKKCEVIGNIFDNPELLERKE